MQPTINSSNANDNVFYGKVLIKYLIPTYAKLKYLVIYQYVLIHMLRINLILVYSAISINVVSL